MLISILRKHFSVLKDVFKINVQRRPRNAAPIGDLLKRDVFVAFFDKNVERFFEYFMSAFVVFDDDRHGMPFSYAFSFLPEDIEYM